MSRSIEDLRLALHNARTMPVAHLPGQDPVQAEMDRLQAVNGLEAQISEQLAAARST